MTVTITLSIAGPSTGPFSLYSNVDGYTTPFEIQVPKPLLVAGYTSVSVPAGTTIIQVRSLGTCTNSINLPIDLLGTSTTTVPTTSTTTVPTTTTSTSTSTTSTSTSTTTTTAPITSTTSTSTTSTTTTTEPPLECVSYTLNAPGTSGEYNVAEYIDCSGQPAIIEAHGYADVTFCAIEILFGMPFANGTGVC